MIKNPNKIKKYAESLIYHNVYDNYDDALEESKRFWKLADKGLVEPMKCLPTNWCSYEEEIENGKIIHYTKCDD